MNAGSRKGGGEIQHTRASHTFLKGTIYEKAKAVFVNETMGSVGNLTFI